MFPQNPKTLGEKIRKTRIDKGLLIRELAKLIGVTPDSIINWEIRGVKPRERSFKKLAVALDFSKNLVYNYSVA
ncbi:MAG: hypothetical protein CO035_07910 [Candidatus Omnitrophica bacterium CG_4_9_14_0_2_um_filter_42_8]|nr:MAG: hypothetical protein COW92_03325 [Candidatus Omnitrophica bacterium CG22_combo_CG10-13_8_21_14_all_43_16]PJC47020.1 MAG: hypothetical protein CO035_07910 [Candidatus Omnitrophica bacterium CG_4_9_14_0_2_um_filter_42_8]